MTRVLRRRYKKEMPYIILVVIIVVLISAQFIANYNNLVKARQRTMNAWSQVEVQLQKRFDLIPNIVEIVKGYAVHESEVLKEVTNLRTSWGSAQTAVEKDSADKKADDLLKSIFAIAENYPQLKANANFTLLQTQLSDIERQIAFSRQFYNDAVTKYNTKLEIFPSNIFAHIYGFKMAEFYQLGNEKAKDSVNVKF